MNLTLRRTSLGPIATVGTVTIKGLTLHTLEDAMMGEAEGEPVPAGEYQLVPHDSAKYGRIWAMVNPALGIYHQQADAPANIRSKIRFACLFAHSGNKDEDTLGCVLVGLTAGKGFDAVSQREEPMVFKSKDAVAALKAALPWEPHTLTVVNL